MRASHRPGWLIVAAGAAALALPLASATGQAIHAAPSASDAPVSISAAGRLRTSTFDAAPLTGSRSGAVGGDMSASVQLRRAGSGLSAWISAALTSATGAGAPMPTGALGVRVGRGAITASLAVGHGLAYAAGDTLRNSRLPLTPAQQDSVAQNIQRPLNGGGTGPVQPDVAMRQPPARSYAPVRTTDAALSLQWSPHRAEVRLTGGMRVGAGWPARPWVGGDVAVAVTPSAALVAGVVRRDVASALPQSGDLPRVTSASLGVRITAVPRTKRRPAPPRPTTAAGHGGGPLAGGGRAGAVAFVAEPEGPAVRVRVRAPGATLVEIAGDITQWRALPLWATHDGWWEVLIPADPGVHRVRLRVDAGPWSPPPGLPQVRDEFGGTLGLLVVVDPPTR